MFPAILFTEVANLVLGTFKLNLMSQSPLLCPLWCYQSWASPDPAVRRLESLLVSCIMPDHQNLCAPKTQVRPPRVVHPPILTVPHLRVLITPEEVMVVYSGAQTASRQVDVGLCMYQLATCYFSHGAHLLIHNLTRLELAFASAALYSHLSLVLPAFTMKAIGRKIRNLQSHIASRSSSPLATSLESSDVPTTQPGDLHTLPTQVISSLTINTDAGMHLEQLVSLKPHSDNEGCLSAYSGF